jgi:hypothetical protein
MNRVIASVYAICIRHPNVADQPFTDDQKQKLLDCIDPLVNEVERLEFLLNDPWIATYLKVKEEGGFVLPVGSAVNGNGNG